MNVVLRNFFYAVGFTFLFALYGLDVSTAQFADLVRLVQSPVMLQLVVVLTPFLVGLELLAKVQRDSRARWAALTGVCSASVAHSQSSHERAGAPSGGVGALEPSTERAHFYDNRTQPVPQPRDAQ